MIYQTISLCFQGVSSYLYSLSAFNGPQSTQFMIYTEQQIIGLTLIPSRFSLKLYFLKVLFSTIKTIESKKWKVVGEDSLLKEVFQRGYREPCLLFFKQSKLIFYYYSSMINDRNKVVQNYALEELRQVWPDRSEIWTAKHKILKKCFTLKRVKYSSTSAEKAKMDSRAQEGSEGEYERLMRIINALKRLNLECAPRCQKMIKTSSHLYVVYDQFPAQTLAGYIRQNNLDILEKWQLMEALVRAVKEIHSKEYVVIGLNPESIYLRGKQGILIGDWSLSKNMAINQVIEEACIPPGSKFISDEVRELGIYGFWSDVFSLGKIFMEIDNSGVHENNLLMKKKLSEMIDKMLSKVVQDRPSLELLLVFFSGKSEEPMHKKSLRTVKSFGEDSTQSIMSKQTVKLKQAISVRQPSETASGQFIARHNTQASIHPYCSIFQLQVPSPTSLRMKTQKIITQVSTPLRKPQTRFSLGQNLSNLRMSKNSDKSHRDSAQGYMTTCRQRNLAFLLLDLSEFVIRMEICPDLAYLLLKKSLIILKAATQEQISKNGRTYESKAFVTILKQEYMHISQAFQLLKESLNTVQNRDESMQRQFSQQKINDYLFNEKIIDFARGMVFNCEKKTGGGICISNLSEVLFKTYLILKKIEEGSYNRFWSKVCRQEYIFLSHQKFLKEEKSLGYRYLKSKIAEILSKKR